MQGRALAPCRASRRAFSCVAATALPKQFKAVKPVGDRVFVKVDKEEVKSIGGVLLPSGAGKKSTAGTIVALGDATLVKSGDRVIYSKFAGTDISVGEEAHVLLKEDDVIGVLSKGDKIGSMLPLGDRVLIKSAKAAAKSAGGVLLNVESAEKPTFGTVVAVGGGKAKEGSDEIVPPNVKPGQTVMYSKYSGTEFEEDDDQFIVVRENDVLAALE